MAVHSKKRFCPKNPAEIVLSVLGYHEDDKWVALALEMDLRGYGDTFTQAFDELCELVIMQISFALHKRQPEMIFKPAEKKYFQRFEKVRNQRLMQITQKPKEEGDFAIRSLPILPAVIAEQMRKTRAYARTT